MGDLDNSPLFDRRHIDFIRSILQDRPLNPLSGIEQKFLKQALILKGLDEKYNGNLVAKLDSYKKYVSVRVAIEFLIEARRYNMLSDAIEVLDTSVIEERGGELKALLKILDEAKTIPAAWAVTVYGEGSEDRHKKDVYTMPSGLNLEAMENFK